MASRATLAPLRRAAAAAFKPSGARNMSGGHSYAEELAEMNKWRTVTAIVAPCCVLFSIYSVATASHHSAEKIPYPYLHIRTKQFPWVPAGAPDLGLFEAPPHKAHH